MLVDDTPVENEVLVITKSKDRLASILGALLQNHPLLEVAQLEELVTVQELLRCLQACHPALVYTQSLFSTRLAMEVKELVYQLDSQCLVKKYEPLLEG